MLRTTGVFEVEEKHHSITICPRHRAENGIRWRSGKVTCAVPTKTVTPDDDSTGSLWKNLRSSIEMSQLLGTETLSPSEQTYLKSLGEAYGNAQAGKHADRSYQLCLV